MKLTKISMITGDSHTLDIPATQEELDSALRAMEDGELIQNILPQLSDDQREFIMTGITAEEWDQYLGDECDE